MLSGNSSGSSFAFTIKTHWILSPSWLKTLNSVATKITKIIVIMMISSIIIAIIIKMTIALHRIRRQMFGPLHRAETSGRTQRLLGLIIDWSSWSFSFWWSATIWSSFFACEQTKSRRSPPASQPIILAAKSSWNHDDWDRFSLHYDDDDDNALLDMMMTMMTTTMITV